MFFKLLDDINQRQDIEVMRYAEIVKNFKKKNEIHNKVFNQAANKELKKVESKMLEKFQIDYRQFFKIFDWPHSYKVADDKNSNQV